MSDVLAIRTSDRGTFKRCRTLWNYKSPLRMRLQPVVGPKPLEFGIAIHEGMEVYYDPDLFLAGDMEVREKAALKAFYDSCKEQRQLRKEKGAWDDEAAADFDEREELGRGMLEHYFMWAPAEDTKWIPKLSEIEFEVPVPYPQNVAHREGFRNVDGQLHYMGTPVVYQGRIDLIIEDEEGFNWIVDHKTAAQFTDTAHLEMDEQCGSYAWAVQQQLGIPIRGVIYNELRKKVPKPARELKNGGFSVAKNQDTTYAIYLRSLEGAGVDPIYYEEFLSWLEKQPNTFFRRTVVHRTQKEFDRLAHRIGLEAIDMLGDPFIYPTPNRMNCNGCAFRSPCLAAMDGSDESYFLNDSGMYVKG